MMARRVKMIDSKNLESEKIQIKNRLPIFPNEIRHMDVFTVNRINEYGNSPRDLEII